MATPHMTVQQSGSGILRVCSRALRVTISKSNEQFMNTNANFRKVNFRARSKYYLEVHRNSSVVYSLIYLQ